jgi:hypothetical protein
MKNKKYTIEAKKCKILILQMYLLNNISFKKLNKSRTIKPALV